jgi:hypothetical protein
MQTLMYGDVREEIDAVTFRKMMDPDNKKGYLNDLTFNLINVAIERGYKRKLPTNAT